MGITSECASSSSGRLINTVHSRYLRSKFQAHLKKLHSLLIKSYFGPFILTFFITLFIFVMQFLWKYIDELVGKGLEWYLVAELLFYASANLVPMALPLAILLASIMTFGSFGEHYELVAMKSSGMSLIRIMYPLLLFTCCVSVGAFLFTNHVWPKANLEFASLLYDIRHKKPSFDIQQGIYYKGLDGYVIRVGSKDEDGVGLNDVLIYDHSKRDGNKRVIRAETGSMEMSEDENYLIFTLRDGYSYKEEEGKNYPHMGTSFGEEIMRFDLSGFEITRSDKDIFKDNYQMLNLSQLRSAMDTLNMQLVSRKNEFGNLLVKRTSAIKVDSAENFKKILSDSARIASYGIFKVEKRTEILEAAMSQARGNKTYVLGKAEMFASNERSIRRHEIEWHRKFTLSIACILLFFIGAPLGAIIRKGGLGLPVVISVMFFLIFHISSITGEKLAKQGEMTPIGGMWMATAILLPIGIFLTYKATTDSSLLDMDTYSKNIQRATRFVRGLLRLNS